MTIDWVSVAIAVASALVTAWLHTSAQGTPAPSPAPATTSSAGGLFHGGLLNRLRGGSSGSAPAPAAPSTPAPSPVAPTATAHPVINSLLSILESEVNSTQGQQLLSQLANALITLTGSNGQQIAVQAGSQSQPQTPISGGTTNATSASSSPASAGS